MATQAFFTKLGISGAQTGVFFAANLSRSLTSHVTGSWYFEITINATTDVTKIGVGIDNDQESLIVAAGRTGSICWLGDGTVSYNSYNRVYSASQFSVGDVLGVNVDLTSSRIQFRRNGNAFSNNFSIAAITGGPMFALVQLASAGDQVTTNFTGTFAFTPPSTAWG